MRARKSLAHWASLIASYAHSRRPQKSLQTYLSMLDHGFQPDLRIFLHLFKACGSTRDLDQGKALHSHARDLGFTSDPFVACSLLNMFGKCGSILCSEEVFHHLPDRKRDVIFWNSMLSAYVEQGHDEKALQLYSRMRKKHIRPDHTTYAVALRACTSLAESEESPSVAYNHTSKLMYLEIGQALHADARRHGLASHVMVASSLACLYGKCGATMQVENTFDTLAQHTIVTLTALISAYKEHGQEIKALQLYLQMHKEGIVPDQHVFSIVLQACVFLAEKEEATLMEGERIKVIPLILGQSLHVDAARKSFLSNMFVTSTLVTMYSKCGSLDKAENVFKKVSKMDLVLLTTILSAYVEHGQAAKALELYKKMQMLGIPLDAMAFARILQACGEAGRLDICWKIHFNTVCSGNDSNRFLGSCLVHSYGACSCLTDALAVFDNLAKPDFVSWNAAISGHMREGNCETHMQMFERMQATGNRPNNITFFSILCVCSHGGYVAEGVAFFEGMNRDYGIQSDSKHYAIVMDLLARVGDFAKAKNIAEQIPEEVDLSLTSSLLGACLQHGNLELGEEIFNYYSELEPQDYVIMSNLYADTRLKEYDGVSGAKKR